jgi:hypothetical protein
MPTLRGCGNGNGMYSSSTVLVIPTWCRSAMSIPPPMSACRTNAVACERARARLKWYIRLGDEVRGDRILFTVFCPITERARSI